MKFTIFSSHFSISDSIKHLFETLKYCKFIKNWKLLLENSFRILNWLLKIIRLPFDLITLLLMRWFPGYRKLPVYGQRIISTMLILLILFSSAYSYLFLIKPKQASAAWYACPECNRRNDSWGYRQRVDITNGGVAQTDFQERSNHE